MKWILILTLLLVISVLIYYYCFKKPEIQPFQGDIQWTPGSIAPLKKCICVFDIDHTINVGNPIPYISTCIENNCRLAINTARPVKYIDDVPIKQMGFVEPHFVDSDFYWNPSSYSQTEHSIATIKSNYMEVLQNKYKVPKSCVILLDDNQTNIKYAKQNGFSTVLAKKNIGLPESELSNFRGMVRRCL